MKQRVAKVLKVALQLAPFGNQGDAACAYTGSTRVNDTVTCQIAGFEFDGSERVVQQPLGTLIYLYSENR